jgi:predicted mannosyl-3-phosphoglycerate phosphatase (HAD superfamily)
MPLDSDSKGILDDLTAQKFQESSPDEQNRSTASIIERLRKMQDTYKFVFHDNVADLVDISLTTANQKTMALLAKFLGSIERLLSKDRDLQKQRRCAS